MIYSFKTLCSSLLLVLVVAATAGAGDKTLAEQLLVETNLARTAPAQYAGFIKELRRQFLGTAFRLPGSLTLVQTSEGTPALDEAIDFLSRQKPLPPLSWSPGLAKAAADLVRDQGDSGGVGHTGSRSGGMQKRIEKHGTWDGSIAENIAYGSRTARLMVMQLIIDDGVPGRGHRKNIFTPGFAAAGAACGPHPVYHVMCAMEFAVRFK